MISHNFGNTPIGNIFIAGIFLAATGLFDVCDAVFFHRGLLLTRYSFFLFTVSAALILVRHFANSFERINAENETLEVAVIARTIALEEQVCITERA